ncbi:MAG: DUF1559 domain-containing protein [Planctomycetales bacterium]|nr:DUF1559 domain-containing protein [Planctomycetales bacterium]
MTRRIVFTPRPHRAFTLVELLTVIAIIGALSSLLLPAVQNARESSRRSQCSNQLRQIGVAALNYESARGTLPPGAVAREYAAEPATPHTFYRWSALAHVLPHLELGAAAAHVDLDVPLYGNNLQVTAQNRDGVAQMIGLFLCPSDRGERVNPAFGPTNYAVCTGSGLDGGSPLESDGLSFINSYARLAEATDGTSHTVYAAECLLGETPPAGTLRDSADPRLVYGFTLYVPMTEQGCQSTSQWNVTDPPGFSWANGELRSALYNNYRPPNSREFDCMGAKIFAPKEVRNAAYGWHAARSNHPGGVNSQYADGAVRFVSDEIAPTVWQGQGTRAGGESQSP